MVLGRRVSTRFLQGWEDIKRTGDSPWPLGTSAPPDPDLRLGKRLFPLRCLGGPLVRKGLTLGFDALDAVGFSTSLQERLTTFPRSWD